jgi:hypothetical protein
MSAPDANAVTPDTFHATETTQGLLPCRGRRETFVYQILCSEIDVQCELVVDILYDRPAR